MYLHTHAHPPTPTYTSVCCLICIYIYMRTRVCVYIHTHLCVISYIHTHTHTHTHLCVIYDVASGFCSSCAMTRSRSSCAMTRSRVKTMYTHTQTHTCESYVHTHTHTHLCVICDVARGVCSALRDRVCHILYRLDFFFLHFIVRHRVCHAFCKSDFCFSIGICVPQWFSRRSAIGYAIHSADYIDSKKATWLMHVCVMTHACMRHDSCMYVSWLMCVCVMTHACMSRDSWSHDTYIFELSLLGLFICRFSYQHIFNP